MNIEQHDPRNLLNTNRRNLLLTICLWAIFAAGLLVEALAPRLQIENRAFVMPANANVEGQSLRPDLLVERERRMQLAAALLSVGGALALGIYYRRTLVMAVKG